MFEKFDREGKVICQLCGQSFLRLTSTHLKKSHNLSIAEYRKNFPDFPMIALYFYSDNIEKISSESSTISNIPIEEIDLTQMDETPKEEIKHLSGPKDKIKIILFLRKYFPTIENNYKIKLHNEEFISDMGDPKTKTIFDFPNSFWHNRIYNRTRDRLLKQNNWNIIIIESRTYPEILSELSQLFKNK